MINNNNAKGNFIHGGVISWINYLVFKSYCMEIKWNRKSFKINFSLCSMQFYVIDIYRALLQFTTGQSALLQGSYKILNLLHLKLDIADNLITV